MVKPALWMIAIFFLAILAGPLAFLTNQAGRADRDDLYIAIQMPTKTDQAVDIATFGARPIGPINGILGKLILAPPLAHARLYQAGYLLFPASTIAALCGFDPASQTLTSRI